MTGSDCCYRDHSGWTNFDWVGEIGMRSLKSLALAICLAVVGVIVLGHSAHAASVAGVPVSGLAILFAFGLGLIGWAIFRRR